MHRAVTVVTFLSLLSACNEPRESGVSGTKDDPTIPKPAPVGPLAQPVAQPPGPPQPAVEMRGALGPTGTFGVDVYRKRRRALMDKLGTSTALILNEMKYEGARDGMDFYWLTGIDEPGAALVLIPSAPIFKEILLLEKRDVDDERWHGERAPIPNRALEVQTGIARIVRKAALTKTLMEACERYGSLAYVGDFRSWGDNPVLTAYREASGKMLGCEIKDLHGTVAAMRAAHDDAELALMRKAIGYTAAGHAAAISAVKQGAREYEVKEAIESAFRRAGSRHLAFDSITGSGPNAAVLHYPKDDRAMNDGELIVVDIGAEAEFYAADVTRTLPISGRYTPEQREIVDIVLRAQQAGIDAAKAGATVPQIDKITRDVIAEAGYYDFYYHGCCHFVGLEVHDVGDYDEPLVPGMVITVEPGIYLPHRGFGVRIEDEVLITATGNEVLTRDIPKTPDQIEAAMAAARGR